MVDILIPLGKGSRHQDIELRYCLRSIEKHLPGVGNVWIVGERPEWLRNVVHVPCQDSPNNWNRARNIYQKILKGCDSLIDFKAGWDSEDFTKNQFTVSGIVLSDHFLFMNDDHYLLQDYEVGEFPYYYRGYADLKNMENNPPQYRQYANTRAILDQQFKDFGVHCPMVMSKDKFRVAFKGLIWPEHGYEIKSTYATKDMQYGCLCDDLKFSQPALPETIYRLLEDRPWFSVGDRCLKSGGMLTVLAELYLNKSKYEL